MGSDFNHATMTAAIRRTLLPSERKPSDPPAFWVMVIAISVVLHLIALVSLRLFALRATVTPAPAPIALEFVDPATIARAPAVTQPSTPTQAPQTATAQPNSTTADPSSIPAVAPTPDPGLVSPPPVQRSAPAPVPTPPVQSPPRSSPQPTPSAPARNRPLPPEPTQEQTVPPAEPPPPSSPDSANPATGDRTTEPPQTSDNRLPPPTGGANPPLPPNGGETGNEDGLPSVDVSERRQQGAGVAVTIMQVKSANDGKDVTDAGERAIARPITDSRTFADMVYPSQIGLNLGETVTLLVLVDKQGNPTPQSVLQGGRTAEYNELAKQLLQQFQFQPAQQEGQNVDTLIQVELRIDAL